MSVKQIADMFGCSRSAISLWLKKHRISTRQNTDIGSSELYKHHDWLAEKYLTEGLSTAQIGKICGRDHNTILFWLRKLSIARRRPSKAMIGKKFSQNHRQKIGAAVRFRLAHSVHPALGYKHTVEARERIRQSKLGQKRPADLCARLSAIRKAYCKDHPEHILAMHVAMQRRPNGPEKILGTLIPGKIQYVGDGSWWTSFRDGRHKNPDFIVPGQNKVIEVFGDYWHRNDNPKILIDLYKQIGFDCLVIWERELRQQPALVQGQVHQFLSK